MTSELCPKCAAPRSMSETTSRREEIGPDGETIKIVTTSYHCQTCGTFVRSEDREEKTGPDNEDTPAGQGAVI